MLELRNQKLLLLVRQLRRLYRDLYNARPTDCDTLPVQGASLTRSQNELLSTLVKHKGGLSVTALAETLKISSSAITQLVDPLVKKGLLIRQENPADRRSVLVALKRPAAPQRISFEEFYAAHISPMFEELSDTELDQLLRLTEKVKNK